MRARALVFCDHRRFGLMTLAREEELLRHPLLKDLGLEPLSPAFTPEALAARLDGRRTPLKSALIDQHVIAGLGNIYASEALYRAQLSPRRRAATLTDQRAARLVCAIRAVLEEAIAAGGSSLRDLRSRRWRARSVSASLRRLRPRRRAMFNRGMRR